MEKSGHFKIKTSNPRIICDEEPWNLDARFYDARFYKNKIGQYIRNSVWEQILKLLPSGGNILDLGCGSGDDALYLANLGYNVLGIDISSNMIKIANKKRDLLYKKNFNNKQLNPERMKGFCFFYKAEITDFLIFQQQHLSKINKTLKLHKENTLNSENLRMQVVNAPIINEFNHFDLVISNFGPLNNIKQEMMSQISHYIRKILLRSVNSTLNSKNEHKYFLSINLNRFCLAELLYFLSIFKIKKAVRRLKSDRIMVNLNRDKRTSICCKYYTPKEFYSYFKDDFKVISYEALPFLVIPPYIYNFGNLYNKFSSKLINLDKIIRKIKPFRSFGDHFMITMKIKSR